MEKVFLLYNLKNSGAASAVEKIRELLLNGGFVVFDLNSENVRQGLLESRFLIFFAQNDDEQASRIYEEHWRFFLNEITWKRKEKGDIVIINGPEATGRRIPYKLKDCTALTFDGVGDLPQILEGFGAPVKQPEKIAKAEETHPGAEETKDKDENKKRAPGRDEYEAYLMRKYNTADPFSQNRIEGRGAELFEEYHRNRQERIDNNAGGTNLNKPQEKDPFDDWRKHRKNNKFAGCAVAGFFIVFFGVLLITILNSLP